jgi:tRNA(Ile)-lysidine synthase
MAHPNRSMPMMTLRARILRTLQRDALVPRGARIVAALSGGADSVALVHLLRELEAAGDVVLAGVAHFNHQLRGADADDDERFCREAAAQLGLPFEAGRADVRAIAREQARSIEDAARVARYQFLENAADALGANFIAVAHTRDDQAETFLLRLLRGAGPRGLAGILPRAGRVIRPLLDVSRAELRELIADRRLLFRDDASNADVSIPRNRVRHELIPYLQREFSPGVVDVLAREAAIARVDEEHLHAEAIELARSVVLESKGQVEVDIGAVATWPAALSSRVVREILARAASGRYVGAEHVEQFLDLVHGRVPGPVSLPGSTARRVAGRIVVGPAPARPFSNSFRFPLSIPGEVTLAPQGWAVSAVWTDGPLDTLGTSGAPDDADSRWTVPVQATAIALPLAVRSRRPGDRFRPLGLGGRGKKLHDFLIDRKVPQEVRDSLPLVVDGDDRIVWVVGQAVGEEFRVTAPSQGVILLKARRLGGLG